MQYLKAKPRESKDSILGERIRKEQRAKSTTLGALVMIAILVPLFAHAEEGGGGHYMSGANGYYYQQISGDSGSGARLGEFKGRTVGIGTVLSYAAKIWGKDFVAELKWLPELDVKNRLDSEYIWFKLAMVF
jgi:hypothetical protein